MSDVESVADQLADAGVVSFSGPDSEGYFCVQEECDSYYSKMLSREQLRTLAYELLAMAERQNAPPPPPPPTQKTVFWMAVAGLHEINLTISKALHADAKAFESVADQASNLCGEVVVLGDAFYCVSKTERVIGSFPSLSIALRPTEARFRPRVDFSGAVSAWFDSADICVLVTRNTKYGCGMYSAASDPV